VSFVAALDVASGLMTFFFLDDFDDDFFFFFLGSSEAARMVVVLILVMEDVKKGKERIDMYICIYCENT